MLFSFQMCAKILEAQSKINMDEYNFFLRGGVVSGPVHACHSQMVPCNLSTGSWPWRTNGQSLSTVVSGLLLGQYYRIGQVNQLSWNYDFIWTIPTWLAYMVYKSWTRICTSSRWWRSNKILIIQRLYPGEWENSCNELQRMVIVRSLRSDRVSFCATSFIVKNLGAKFVEPPVLDMKQVVGDSTTRSPLIFVLSSGVVS